MKEIDIEVGGCKTNACYLYDEVENPKGVVLVIHGMQEHARRYDKFCTALNSNGYIVFVSDLRGHGKNMPLANPGYSDGNIFAEIVLDHVSYIKKLKTDYKGLPLIVFGHSFGSFIAQRLIVECDTMVDKFILCGSAYANCLKFKAGLWLAVLSELTKGRKAEAKLVEKCSIKGYGKKFKNGNWLSRDEMVMEEYRADLLCGLPFPNSFYTSFFGSAIENYKNLALVDESTPILLISGTNDPVGDYGKSVKKLYKVYRKHWLNVYMKLYEGARHELLNETNSYEVVHDIISFIEADNKRNMDR